MNGKENPGWDKNWQAGVCSVGEVGEMHLKGEANSGGWNEILDRASRQPGANVRKTAITVSKCLEKRRSDQPIELVSLQSR